MQRSNNRRLRQCKISISEVLISVTLSWRGEVAERLKAAVCETEIRLSDIFDFLRNSFRSFNFSDRSCWLLLALEPLSWELPFERPGSRVTDHDFDRAVLNEVASFGLPIDRAFDEDHPGRSSTERLIVLAQRHAEDPATQPLATRS